MKNHRTLFEQVSSPFCAQILEFCESELFQDTIQNSEVASSSNGCCEEQSSNTTNLSFPTDIIKCPAFADNTNALTTTTIATTAPTTNNFSLIFQEEITENDLSTPLDLTNPSHFTNYQYPFSDQDQFEQSLLQNQIPLTIDNTATINGHTFTYPHDLSNDHDVPIVGPTTLETVCEEDSLSSMPPCKFMQMSNRLSPNYSFIDPYIHSYLPRSTEGSRIFNGNMFLGNEIQTHDLEFQGDNGGIFCNDPMSHSYNSNELQALSNESQHLVNGCVINSTTPLASEITSLDSESFRVTNKLTREERKEKIDKYLKKRNQRNFNKKIKYACRKTLADSRPRVRGRFAKNAEFGEGHRSTNSNHEEDTDEDILSFNQGVVKQEEGSFESSDMFARMSGFNSFKRNHTIQSWI